MEGIFPDQPVRTRMPVVACPSCSERLSVPEDFIGRKVRCASCATVFAAEEPPSDRRPPPEPWAEDRYSDRPVPAERESDGGRIQDGANQRFSDLPATDELRRDPRDRDDYPPRDYEEEYDQRRYMRRDVLPHRGGVILTLGIISTAGSLICGVFGGFLGLGLGIPAVLMGRRDLQQIDAGTMDPDGHGLTKAGLICGIIGIVLGILLMLACGVYLVFVMTVLRYQ
jgi:hypothetical protein